MKRAALSALVLVCLLGSGAIGEFACAGESPSPPEATGFRAEFLNQLDGVEKKLLDLAEAMPEEKYTWRPGEGVRSVSEAYMHVAGANFFLTGMIGVDPPADVGRDLEKITDKAKVLELLKQSFEHVRQAALKTPDAEMDKPVEMFGRQTTVRDLFLMMALHQHEHLGQAIAYARMNGIVPPWSAARQPQQGE